MLGMGVTMEKHGRVAGALIIVAVVGMPLLAAIIVPRVQQGWEKRGGTEIEFKDNDGSCAAMQEDPSLRLTDAEKKQRHHACMRAHGWSALQRWQ